MGASGEDAVASTKPPEKEATADIGDTLLGNFLQGVSGGSRSACVGVVAQERHAATLGKAVQNGKEKKHRKREQSHQKQEHHVDADKHGKKKRKKGADASTGDQKKVEKDTEESVETSCPKRTSKDDVAQEIPPKDSVVGKGDAEPVALQASSITDDTADDILGSFLRKVLGSCEQEAKTAKRPTGAASPASSPPPRSQPPTAVPAALPEVADLLSDGSASRGSLGLDFQLQTEPPASQAHTVFVPPLAHADAEKANSIKRTSPLDAADLWTTKPPKVASTPSGNPSASQKSVTPAASAAPAVHKAAPSSAPSPPPSTTPQQSPVAPLQPSPREAEGVNREGEEGKPSSDSEDSSSSSSASGRKIAEVSIIAAPVSSPTGMPPQKRKADSSSSSSSSSSSAESSASHFSELFDCERPQSRPATSSNAAAWSVKRRACAKMSVISKLRCACHFALLRSCPDQGSEAVGNEFCTDDE